MLLPAGFYLFVMALAVWTERPYGAILRRTRRHPLVISGQANMLGVLFAVSGFLLIGPPTWIIAPFRSWGALTYGCVYVSYLLMLLLLGIWLVRRQRHTLVLLHMNPTQFAMVLQDVLAKLKLDYTAAPGRVALAGGKLVLDIETSFVMNNVVLSWHGEEPEIRDTVEAELRTALAEFESEDGPAALLLLMMAAAVFLFIFFAVMVNLIVMKVLKVV